jgi:hypothetical protein
MTFTTTEYPGSGVEETPLLASPVTPAKKTSTKKTLTDTLKLTNTQKLTKALKVCKKKAKGKRTSCEKAARKKFGAAGAKGNGKK